MNIKEATSIESKRLLSAKEVCSYLGLGMNRGVEFAKSIGSEVRVGRRCLYDKNVIDGYLDRQALGVK
ncbi:hypothetical protein M2150_002714 [Lachnospiraceae bacterium PM6-15]|uniref:polyprenyl synthetase solanesyl diphosphate synthase n=1 Tax=Ohessyouella blattaphilus TaxID=2949333 RepID=UPI003E2A8C11